MVAPISTTASFKMATQTAQASAATHNFIHGRMKESMFLPARDELNPGAEHGVDSSRPTIQKSSSIGTGYMGAFSGSWFLYPDLVGMALRGIGFDSSAAAGTPTTTKTHTFTIQSRESADWMTVLHQVGEGAGAFERMGTDARVANLDIMANVRGAVCSMQGVALGVTDSTGSEVSASETDTLIIPTDGSLTATVTVAGGDEALFTTIRGMRVQIVNPLYTEEVSLFSSARSDLPQLGMAVSGVASGIDVTETIWDNMIRYGATSGSPSMVIPQLALTFKYESPTNISGDNVPYSIQFTIPTAEVRLTPYAASGRNLIRCAMQWNMKDLTSGTEPISIEIVNEVTTYDYAAS
jgi:hypothetical protein